MEFIVRRTSDGWFETITNCSEAREVEFEDNNYSIVKIDSLNDLIKFIDKYGAVIINKKYGFEETKPEHEYRIEIYDDFRE